MRLKVLLAATAVALLVAGLGTARADELTSAEKKCIGCHEDTQPGIVADWRTSKHAAKGISCLDCHEVPAGSAMAITHADLGKTSRMYPDTTISVLVPPSKCAECHQGAAEEFKTGSGSCAD